ncbi:MAG TPA: MFS transporter [Gemmataceae bacterium]|jgi:fucose permease|nr:MFS transporter [Gemmataceae bacterium]
MSAWQELAPLTIATSLIFGMTVALTGSIKAPLAKRLDISEDRVGGLLAVFNLALIPLVLAAGLVIDRLGIKEVLMLGSLLAALGTFALATGLSFRGCQYAILVLGAGASCLNAAAIVLMPQAFFELREAASLNFGCFFLGLGALLTPALLEVLMRFVNFRRTLMLLAFLCLVPAVVAIWTPADHLVKPDGQAHPGHALGSPIVWLAALAFCLYAPIEGALGTWAGTYLTDLGHRERRAAAWLSGFWLTFLAARLVAAWFQQRGILAQGSDPWVILTLAFLAAVALGNLAGTRRRGTAARGLLIVGGLLGPIFPTLVGFVFKHVPHTSRGTAYGAVYAIGASCSLVLPPLIGSYARRTSVRTALRIPTAVALVLAGAALVLGLVP